MGSSESSVCTSNCQVYRSNYGKSGTSKFQYTDKPSDSATGLYYSGARWYDPASARFMTEDTYIGEPTLPLSLNRYIYALDNPMKYVDPSGHESTSSYTYQTTTSQTITSYGDGYVSYFTTITTTTYMVTTTCYYVADCVAGSAVVTAVSQSWVWNVVNQSGFAYLGRDDCE